MNLEEIKNASEQALRLRLGELKGTLRGTARDKDVVQKERYTAAATKQMETDPTKAQDFLLKADALEAKTAAKSPDTIRQNIQAALNAAKGEAGQYIAKNGAVMSDPGYQSRVKLIRSLEKEITLDNPSLQHAYLEAGLVGGAIPDPTDTPVVTEAPVDYNGVVSAIGLVDPKSKTVKEDLKKLQTLVPTLKLSQEQADRVNELVEAKIAQIPAAALTDEQAIKKVKDEIGVGPIALNKTQFGLFAAGLENFGQGNYGTAIQNFIKTSNPNESVMADDINMANKGTIASGLSGLLQKFGIDASGLTVQDIATKLKNTAQGAINNSSASLDTYGLTPAQKELFIRRYYNGASVLANKPGKGGKSKDDRIKELLEKRRKK
jgi:hypothetical protein